MPVALSYPGVYIEEVPSGVRTITGVATSIALFLGWAPRGSVEAAARLTSFADYERNYGGLDLRSPLGYAVQQFYDNGGADAYILRIADADAGARRDCVDRRPRRSPASSPGDWAGRLSRAPRRSAPDDATRFRLDVLACAAATTSSSKHSRTSR